MVSQPGRDVSQPLLAVTGLHEPGVEVSIEGLCCLTHDREEPPLVLIKRQPIEVVRAEHEPGVVIDLMPVAALVFDADLILGDERLEVSTAPNFELSPLSTVSLTTTNALPCSTEPLNWLSRPTSPGRIDALSMP